MQIVGHCEIISFIPRMSCLEMSRDGVRLGTMFTVLNAVSTLPNAVEPSCRPRSTTYGSYPNAVGHLKSFTYK